MPPKNKNRLSKGRSASVKEEEFGQHMSLESKIDLFWYIFGLKVGQDNSIKLPIKWYDSITSSVLYLTLRMDKSTFFGAYKGIKAQEQNDLDLLLKNDNDSLDICLLPKVLRTNIELLYIYKQILTSFYKIIKLNKSGQKIKRVLSDLKDLIVAHSVESIEGSCGYDDEESEEYLGSFKNYFWFDFDTTVSNKRINNLKMNVMEMKIEAMEKYFQNQAYSQGDFGNKDKFMYGLIVNDGLMTLLVRHTNIGSSTPAALPIFNVDLTQLVEPQGIVSIVNRMLLIVELARREMFLEAFTSLEI